MKNTNKALGIRPDQIITKPPFREIEGLKNPKGAPIAEVKQNPVYVTQPALPPLDEFVPYLEEIWSSRRVTNKGRYHQELEEALCNFLGVKYVSLFANGTIALLIALQVLRIQGEVITTPYSFVATTHAIQWNDLKPVFADIDPVTLNLDPNRIEAAITPKTTAILPVHVYGTPCDLDRIDYLADIYGLKVIYDAAHAFGVEKNGQSILNFGDLSVLSFHGTKIFTTFEGGAIVSHDATTKRRIDFLKNFGFADEVTVVGPGINGKMNEFQAALGLLQLKYADKSLAKRKRLTDRYRDGLDSVPGIRLLAKQNDIKGNASYFPIFIEEREYGESRDAVYQRLKNAGFYCRRYFYPLISHFPPYRGISSAKVSNLPIAEEVTRQAICLPLYDDLTDTIVDEIIGALRK